MVLEDAQFIVQISPQQKLYIQMVMPMLFTIISRLQIQKPTALNRLIALGLLLIDFQILHGVQTLVILQWNRKIFWIEKLVLFFPTGAEWSVFTPTGATSTNYGTNYDTSKTYELITYGSTKDYENCTLTNCTYLVPKYEPIGQSALGYMLIHIIKPTSSTITFSGYKSPLIKCYEVGWNLSLISRNRRSIAGR